VATPAPLRFAFLSVACCFTLACWIVHQVAVEEMSRGDSVAVTSPANGFTVLPAAQVAYLEMVWERTWNALLEAASPPVREKLGALTGVP
jgi:hypothetical protein